MSHKRDRTKPTSGISLVLHAGFKSRGQPILKLKKEKKEKKIYIHIKVIYATF